jgi:hypothetical protein
MKLFKLVISFFVIVSLVYSCKPKIENAQTKTIDSLLIALDVAEEKLEHIDFEKLEKSAHIAKENLEKIKPLIVDTLNRDKVFLMSNYAIVYGEEGEEGGEQSVKSNGKDYEDVREKYIEKEVAFCKKQLKNLKNDFTKGEMDLPTFKKYFDVENEKSLLIISFIEMESNSSEHRLALFDSLHPFILKFIDSLEIATSKNK